MEERMEAYERSIPFNERLIEEVRKFPSLYNQSRRTMVDCKERAHIWETIATAVDPVFSGEFAKRRWLQLRDRYRKEVRAVMRRGNDHTKWRHFHRLSWLDPHLKDLDTPTHTREVEDSNKLYERLGISKYSVTIVDPSKHVSSPTESLTFKSEDQEEIALGEQAFPSPMSEEHRQKAAFNDVKQEEPPLREREEDYDASNSPMVTSSLINSFMASTDCMNDEHFTFGRFIALRMKKMNKKKLKKSRAAIMAILDESSEDEEAAKS